jgi:hypothetical protein
MSGTKELQKIIMQASRRHSLWQVWQDFLLMSATAISNAVDWQHRDEREADYMAAVKRYSRDEATLIAQAMACLVDALDTAEPTDVLGETFMALELASKWHGQFFTPYHLCKAMAIMNMDGIQSAVEAKGFVTVNEPACGGGAMVIAVANAMREAGMNPQQQLHVVAQDLDIKGVHMCYLQLALLHIPASVIHGNTLTMEERSHWYTPAHIIDMWDTKLRRGYLLGHGDTKQSGTDLPLHETDPDSPLPANDNRQTVAQNSIAVGQSFSLF